MLCDHFCDISSHWGKVSQGSIGSIVGRGHMGHNAMSHESFTQYVLTHTRPCLFGCDISFCSIFAHEEVRGHDECLTHLKMCMTTFDLLAFILNNGSVGGGVRS